MPAHSRTHVVEVEGMSECAVRQGGLGGRRAKARPEDCGRALGVSRRDRVEQDEASLLHRPGNRDAERVEDGSLHCGHDSRRQSLEVRLHNEGGETFCRLHLERPCAEP
jgi:hypothetical protein